MVEQSGKRRGRQRDRKREALWRRTLARQDRSGLTARAFCRREQLSEPSFYAWRREIARRDAEPRRNTPAGQPSAAKLHPPAFLPVVLAPGVSESGIVIELRGGRLLRLSESIPAARLAELVCALEAACAREIQP